MKEYRNFRKDEKQRLISENKKLQKNKNARRIKESSITKKAKPEQARVIFSDKLGGKLTHTICADRGAVANLMNYALLEKVQNFNSTLKL